MKKIARRVGLEISNSAVRIAEVSATGGRPKVLNLGQVRLPPRAVVDGGVVDSAAVTEAIRRCVKECGFNVKEVHLGVGGLRAITRELEMPQVPENELDSAVRLQALDVIPFPADRTLLSARPLGRVAPPEGHTDKRPNQRVLVAAAHRDLVEPLVEVVAKAGLVPASVDLSSSALVRGMHDPATDGSGPQAIVSIGSGLTTFVVHENGSPHFVRTIAEGGDSVTAAIAGALDIPIEDAERMKRRLYESGPATRAASTAAYEATASLIAELRSSVEYYSTLTGTSEIRRMLLTGGGSQLAGLAERIQLETRAEVVVANAFDFADARSLHLDEEELAERGPSVCTVIGLALSDRAGAKPLDLLPPEVLVERRRRRAERSLLAGVAAVVVVLLGLGVMRYLQVHNAEQTVSSLRQQVARLHAEVAHRSKQARMYSSITADESSVSPIVGNEVNWPVVLRDLAKATPRGGVVTSISGTMAPQVAAPSSSSTSSPTSAGGSPSPSRETTIIADLNVSVSTNNGFGYFKEWLKAMETSSRFRSVQFSGLTHAKGNTVTWTAQLAVLGTIESSRIGKFEVTTK